jgi:ribonuclease VapC
LTGISKRTRLAWFQLWAGLNIGDSFAYAAAKATGEKLLFKGDDFAQTDIPSALPA